MYDEDELRRISPQLHFKGGRPKTGYRTREMLVAPIIESKSGELVGIIQFINSRHGDPFTIIAQEGVKELCETLSIALSQKSRNVQIPPSKLNYLVTEGIVSISEFESAISTARQKANRS